MPFPIQRLPRGLAAILSTFGGQTPRDMADQVAGVVELTQLYGMTQQQIRTVSNAALGPTGTLVLTVPNNETWVVFSAAVLVGLSATMNALGVCIQIGPAGTPVAVAAGEPLIFGPAGSWRLAWTAPYPRVLLPGSVIQMTLDRLGVDPNANCALSAMVGVLG